MIPRILHRVVPEHTTDEAEMLWKRWQSLDWQSLTWRDPLISSDFPLLGHRFEDCIAGAQLAGLVRLEVIYTYGGIYVDQDMELTYSHHINDLLMHPCFVGTEDGMWLTDAMFGAEPGHPGIKACIDAVALMDMNRGPSETGPKNMTRRLRGRDDVTYLSKRAFYPVHYTEKDTLPPIGEWLRDPRCHDSYALHRWWASWVG